MVNNAIAVWAFRWAIIDKKDNFKINCYVTEDTVIVQPGVLNCVQIMNLLLGSYISSGITGNARGKR